MNDIKQQAAARALALWAKEHLNSLVFVVQDNTLEIEVRNTIRQRLTECANESFPRGYDIPAIVTDALELIEDRNEMAVITLSHNLWRMLES